MRIRETGTSLPGHKGQILHLSFTQDGSRLASGSVDSTARIWDVAQGACVHCLSEHQKNVCKTIWSADASRLYTASHDQHIRLWDVASGELKTKIGPHGGLLSGGVSISLSPDERFLASAGGSTVRIWETAGFTITQEVKAKAGFLSYPHDVCYSHDGRLLFVCSRNKILVTETEPPLAPKRFAEHNVMGTTFVRVSPNDSLLASNFFSPLQLWRTSTGDAVPLPGIPASTFANTAFLSDTILLVTTDAVLHVIDIPKHMLLAKMERTKLITTIAVCAKTQTAALGYMDGDIDLVTISEAQEGDVPAEPSGTVAVSNGNCNKCGKNLEKLSAGVFPGDAVQPMLEVCPYPCQSCGAVFCAGCMREIKVAPCPLCGGPLGW